MIPNAIPTANARYKKACNVCGNNEMNSVTSLKVEVITSQIVSRVSSGELNKLSISIPEESIIQSVSYLAHDQVGSIPLISVLIEVSVKEEYGKVL